VREHRPCCFLYHPSINVGAQSPHPPNGLFLTFLDELRRIPLKRTSMLDFSHLGVKGIDTLCTPLHNKPSLLLPTPCRAL